MSAGLALKNKKLTPTKQGESKASRYHLIRPILWSLDAFNGSDPYRATGDILLMSL